MLHVSKWKCTARSQWVKCTSYGGVPQTSINVQRSGGLLSGNFLESVGSISLAGFAMPERTRTRPPLFLGKRHQRIYIVHDPLLVTSPFFVFVICSRHFDFCVCFRA